MDVGQVLFEAFQASIICVLVLALLRIMSGPFSEDGKEERATAETAENEEVEEMSMSQAEFRQWVRNNRKDGFVKVNTRTLKDDTIELTLITTRESKAAHVFNSEIELYKFLRTGGMQGEELPNAVEIE